MTICKMMVTDSWGMTPYTGILVSYY